MTASIRFETGFIDFVTEYIDLLYRHDLINDLNDIDPATVVAKTGELLDYFMALHVNDAD
ncbi:MAG: hypothetical protein P8Y83_10640 [Gammaproteobacteria bacterium]|jgi:hypothetical protein